MVAVRCSGAFGQEVGSQWIQCSGLCGYYYRGFVGVTFGNFHIRSSGLCGYAFGVQWICSSGLCR